MTWNLSPDSHGPTPEQLAAFADGELGPAEAFLEPDLDEFP